jgi:regulator of protease activity HflC (stomatin/prohibitin superfamily)
MNLFDLLTGPMILILLAIVFLTQAIKILNEYERGVILYLFLGLIK